MHRARFFREARSALRRICWACEMDCGCCCDVLHDRNHLRVELVMVIFQSYVASSFSLWWVCDITIN